MVKMLMESVAIKCIKGKEVYLDSPPEEKALLFDRLRQMLGVAKVFFRD
jgi:hypothetical protein